MATVPGTQLLVSLQAAGGSPTGHLSPAQCARCIRLGMINTYLLIENKRALAG